MSPSTIVDPCVSYGRGGAGNIRRRSSILDAWSKISSPSAETTLAPGSSHEEHCANSKPESRSSISLSSRRASSMWSSSTTGDHKSVWRRWFKRKTAVHEKVKTEDSE
ncbi:hypothetical protein BKA66DRAFT_446869 [Pyrenochaeta sp. MPI-SDFR-AT-0127]|nr:hypothetical protein BKA66DRAFT_446869 [Pyrenochaeta sp. MPI-SDFR-AT-0127]